MLLTNLIILISLLTPLIRANNEIWNTLNNTLNGTLKTATPFSLPCFSTYESTPNTLNPSQCSQIQANYSNSLFRAETYSGFQNNQDEMCISNSTDQCLLDSLNPFDPSAFEGISCNQGSVSYYYIDIQTSSDILTAFQFSRETGVKLSIKNSGHDYQSRSSQKDSLALWTRNLRSISRNEHFIPEGGPTDIETQDTITTAAGINAQEVYQFADAQNVTFIGPYGTSIGVSGGWVQTGGHAVLSPVYGLGIDRVLQYKIVTSDGEIRVANAYQNEDLFWALRGGGGGTFGVVLESTHLVEPAVKLSVAAISYKQTASNLEGWLEVLVNNSLPWIKQGWGGHYQINSFLSVTPLLNLSSAQKSMDPAIAYALANNGTTLIEELPSWYSFYEKYVIPNEQPSGSPQIIASRFIPSTIFSSAKGRSALLAYLIKMNALGFPLYVPSDAPFLYPWNPASTSATETWRNAVWYLSTGTNLGWNTTVAEKQVALNSLESLIGELESMIVKEGGVLGSYFNEDSPWTEGWKEKWWGAENYEKLLAVKEKYDPDGLLGCWKCVGFEEEEEKDGCFGALT